MAGTFMGLPDHGNRGGRKDTLDTLEGCQTSGVFLNGVLGVLSPDQVSTPILLMLMTVGPEEPIYLLI